MSLPPTPLQRIAPATDSRDRRVQSRMQKTRTAVVIGRKKQLPTSRRTVQIRKLRHGWCVWRLWLDR